MNQAGRLLAVLSVLAGASAAPSAGVSARQFAHGSVQLEQTDEHAESHHHHHHHGDDVHVHGHGHDHGHGHPLDGHKCLQDEVWAGPGGSRLQPQPGHRRRRRQSRGPIRIKVDTSHIDTTSPQFEQASKYTCFREGQRYIRGSRQVNPIPDCAENNRLCDGGDTRACAAKESNMWCMSTCGANDVLTPQKREYLVGRLMRDATDFFETIFDVDTEDVQLSDFPGATCDARNVQVSIPEEYMLPVEYDMVLFLTAAPTHSADADSSNNVGFARYCVQNQGNVIAKSRLKPIAGVVNIGTNAIALDNFAHTFQWYLVVHEMMHALGFTASLFKEMQSEGRFAIEDIKDMPYGTTRKFVTTPNVQRMVREHFGCDTLPGAQLEDAYGFGGEGGGTAISHWEKRLFANEFMTGVGSPGLTVISNLSLALMEDLGFYYPDYRYGETLLFGHGLGCGFSEKRCDDGVWKQPWKTKKVAEADNSAYFCEDPSGPLCTYDHSARGMCDVTLWTTVPREMQYFLGKPGVGGNSPLSDFCPIVQPYSNGNCLNPTLYNDKLAGSKAPLKDDYSSVACPTCRCFVGQLSSKRALFDYGKTKHVRADCYDTMCAWNTTSDTPALLAFVGQKWLRCPDGGGAAADVDSALYETFNCPSAESMCPRDYALRQLPQVQALNPAEGPYSGPAMVTIFGENFHTLTPYSVTFELLTLPDRPIINATSVRYVSRKELVARLPELIGSPQLSAAEIPPDEIAAVASVHDGFGASSLAAKTPPGIGQRQQDRFKFVRQWPQVTSISPDNGKLAGGYTVVLKTERIDGRAEVFIDGRKARAEIRPADNELRVEVPSAEGNLYSETSVNVVVVSRPDGVTAACCTGWRVVLLENAFRYKPSSIEALKNFLRKYWWIVPLVLSILLLFCCYFGNKLLLARHPKWQVPHWFSSTVDTPQPTYGAVEGQGAIAGTPPVK